MMGNKFKAPMFKDFDGNEHEDIKSLKGLYFFTFTEDGHTHYQGQVLSETEQYIVVELYEWLIGTPTHMEVWAKEKLFNTKMNFYTYREWHGNHYLNTLKPRDDYLRKQRKEDATEGK